MGRDGVLVRSVDATFPAWPGADRPACRSRWPVTRSRCRRAGCAPAAVALKGLGDDRRRPGATAAAVASGRSGQSRAASAGTSAAAGRASRTRRAGLPMCRPSSPARPRRCGLAAECRADHPDQPSWAVLERSVRCCSPAVTHWRGSAAEEVLWELWSGTTWRNDCGPSPCAAVTAAARGPRLDAVGGCRCRGRSEELVGARGVRPSRRVGGTADPRRHPREAICVVVAYAS